MVALPLNDCASKTVSEIQAGGIRGRRMSDNILNLECKALQFMITNQLLSGIFALDQAAAFPSISRAFIHWVLKRMRIPRRIRKLIKALYLGGKSGVNFGGRTYYHFVSGAGVKQGDPASMVIFVLCFDPILRWISSLLSPIGDHLFGYCDDVGIASQNMLRSWPIIQKCFMLVGKFSGLFLNVAKTKCCVIFGELMDHVADELREVDSSLTRNLFNDFVKYLGVYLGPGAEQVMWREAIVAYKECISFLRCIDAGFTSTISLYNVLGASIFSWIGSFAPPSQELLILEGKSLQRLTHGPWNVFPKRLLMSLKTIGYPTQFQCLESNSIAARTRNAKITSTNFQDLIAEVNAALTSGERLCNLPDEPWMKRSYLFALNDAVCHMRDKGFDTSVAFSQSQVSKHLVDSEEVYEPVPFFRKRLGRFVAVDESQVESLIGRYKTIGKRFKPCILSSYVVMVLNGWCTKSRFGHVDEGCIFCANSCFGDIKHLIVCPTLQNVILDCLRQPHIFLTVENLFSFQYQDSYMGRAGQDFVSLYCYLAFRAFNAVRHGEALNKRLIRYFCKRLCFHCKHSRSLIRKYQFNRVDLTADSLM